MTTTYRTERPGPCHPSAEPRKKRGAHRHSPPLVLLHPQTSKGRPDARSRLPAYSATDGLSPPLLPDQRVLCAVRLKIGPEREKIADVGTGSGILALAAAQAGGATVLALDINPNAAQAAAENAYANGFGGSISAVGSNLLSAVMPRPLFDVILSSPPSFPGEPRDMADRAWAAGPNYRDIAMLFAQARERLASNGCMYVLFSTDSDLDLLGALISRAGFVANSRFAAFHPD